MFKNKIKGIYLNLLITLWACGAGIGDTSQELSGGYIYRTDGNCKYILAANIYQEGIYPNIVDFAYDKSFIIAKQQLSKRYLKIFLAQDIRNRYNRIKNMHDPLNQKQVDSILLKKLHIYDNNFFEKYTNTISSENNIDDIKKSEFIADSLIQKNPFYNSIISRKTNYWIINHKNGKLFGPLSNEEYYTKRKELGIPEKLKLNSK